MLPHTPGEACTRSSPAACTSVRAQICKVLWTLVGFHENLLTIGYSFQDPRHFYLWLEGKDLGYTSAAGQRFATQSFLTALVAAIAAIVLLLT